MPVLSWVISVYQDISPIFTLSHNQMASEIQLTEKDLQDDCWVEVSKIKSKAKESPMKDSGSSKKNSNKMLSKKKKEVVNKKSASTGKSIVSVGNQNQMSELTTGPTGPTAALDESEMLQDEDMKYVSLSTINPWINPEKLTALKETVTAESAPEVNDLSSSLNQLSLANNSMVASAEFCRILRSLTCESGAAAVDQELMKFHSR